MHNTSSSTPLTYEQQSITPPPIKHPFTHTNTPLPPHLRYGLDVILYHEHYRRVDFINQTNAAAAAANDPTSAAHRYLAQRFTPVPDPENNEKDIASQDDDDDDDKDGKKKEKKKMAASLTLPSVAWLLLFISLMVSAGN